MRRRCVVLSRCASNGYLPRTVSNGRRLYLTRTPRPESTARFRAQVDRHPQQYGNGEDHRQPAQRRVEPRAGVFGGAPALLNQSRCTLAWSGLCCCRMRACGQLSEAGCASTRWRSPVVRMQILLHSNKSCQVYRKPRNDNATDTVNSTTTPNIIGTQLMIALQHFGCAICGDIAVHTRALTS